MPRDVVVAEGGAVEQIIAHAAQLPADLLVMGPHGRSGFERWVLGSVTEKVLRKAACPVLSVPKEAVAAPVEGRPPSRRILCALDFSSSSLKALEYAMTLAQDDYAEIALLHVLEALPDFRLEAQGFDVARYRATLAAVGRAFLQKPLKLRHPLQGLPFPAPDGERILGVIANKPFVAELEELERRFGVRARAIDAWLPREEHSPGGETRPVGFLELVTRGDLLRIYLVAFGAFFVFSSVFNFLPFYLSGPPFAARTEVITLMYLCYVIGIVIGPLTGKLSNRIGNGTTMALGAVVFAGSIGATLIKSLFAILGSLMGVCAGFFAIHAAAAGSLNRRLTSSRGRANSLYVLFYYLGGATVITLSGYA